MNFRTRLPAIATTRSAFGKWLAVGALFITFGTATAEEVSESRDELVQIKWKRVDAVSVRPGADFRPYTKVMLDPTEVAFRMDWFKDMNRRGPTYVSNHLSEEDAQEMLAAARSSFDIAFKDAYEKAGLTLATSPGPDVLKLSPTVQDMYLIPPQTWSDDASYRKSGKATLVLLARDSTTNALLWRLSDERETLDTIMTGRKATHADIGWLFRNWADICIQSLSDLKRVSPIPEDVKPKQKLN